MWMFTNSKGKSAERCEEACDALERSARTPGGERIADLRTLLEEVPEGLAQHVRTCEACRLFAEELVQVRALFAERGAKPEPGPYFLARVMNSIADREMRLEKRAQIWAAVPRLAYRLTVLASLVLLAAGSWAYRLQTPKSANTSLSAQSGEGLVDAGSLQDDLLVSAADR